VKPPLDSRFVEVRGLAVHHWASRRSQSSRASPPLVLVHGLGVSSRYFLRLAGLLAADRPVFAPDLPGFGRSATPRRPLDVHAQADFLAAWMPAAGLERAAFFGHSLGSQVVADLALHHPRLVDRLILAAPTIDDAGRSIPRELFRLLRDVPLEPFSLVPIVARAYLRAGLGRVLRTLRYALADRLESKLPALALPVLVLRGARDPVVSERWSEKVAELLPQGRLAVVPGAAHALQFSHPREVAALLKDFWGEGLPSPPPSKS
jgi:2-hydroxy-6-oxonona-2,4-dienedioate hydrolase